MTKTYLLEKTHKEGHDVIPVGTKAVFYLDEYDPIPRGWTSLGIIPCPPGGQREDIKAVVKEALREYEYEKAQKEHEIKMTGPKPWEG